MKRGFRIQGSGFREVGVGPHPRPLRQRGAVRWPSASWERGRREALGLLLGDASMETDGLIRVTWTVEPG